MKKITIAVDGYSSCGKSTMAHDLALSIGYTHIDTGAMYRAVTLVALRHNLFGPDNTVMEPDVRRLLPAIAITQALNPATGSVETYLDGLNVETEIRSMEVSQRVSIIAALPFVREEMVRQQQQMGNAGGVVVDGRDIGTTVFPQAEMKIFVTADKQERARRRFLELKSKGKTATIDEVARNLQERDYIDTHREVSPLRQAGDAVVIDNTNLTPREQLAILLALFHCRTEE